jgi:hypothetical protein
MNVVRSGMLQLSSSLLTSLLVVSLSGCAQATQRVSDGASSCWPSDSVGVAAHLDYLTGLVTGEDSSSVAFRKAFDLLKLSPREVTLVTHPSTCAAAASAVNHVAGTVGRPRQVWVYSLGSAYAVEDPSYIPEGVGAGYPFWFFDRRWTPMSVLMY